MPIEFIDNKEAIKKAIRRGVKDSLDDLADKIVQEAVQKVPVNNGDLQRSISRDPVKDDPGILSVEFGSYGVPHAAPTEWGSGISGEPFVRPPEVAGSDWPAMPPDKQTFSKYPIVPVNARALHWKKNGKDVFAQKVMHPGVPPQPFMRPAIDSVRLRSLKPILRKNINKHLQEFRVND